MTSDLAGTGGTRFGLVTEAAAAYFRKVNEEDGGVCDRDIDFTGEDDEYAGQLALEKTRELVEQDEVAAIVGAVGLDAHLEVVDYLNDPNGDGNKDDGIPDLFVSSGYSGWGDFAKWPWTTGLIPDYATDATVQAQQIVEGFPNAKVGILYQNDAFGQDYLNALQGPLGAKIALAQPHDLAAVDLAPQVQAIRDAGADLVFLATTPQFVSSAITSAHEQGYRPQFFMSYVNTPTVLAGLLGGGSSAEQIAAGLAELEGSISTRYLLDSVTDSNEPPMAEHQRIMEDFEGPAVSSLSVYGQTLAEAVVHTLEIACENGDLTRQGIREAAESVEEYHPSLLIEGVNLTLGADDHRAIQSLMPVKFNLDGTLEELADAPVSLD
jgi:branched-chain amino acid transport system substrate-binding protein